MQENGHRGRRGVAVFVDVHGDLGGGDVEAVSDRIEDTHVGLVKQEVVDLLDADLVGLQTLLNDLTETPYGLRKHGAAFHVRQNAVTVDFLLDERREGGRAKQLSVELGEQGTVGM